MRTNNWNNGNNQEHWKAIKAINPTGKQAIDIMEAKGSKQLGGNWKG